MVATVAPGPPPLSRRYAVHLARRALWREVGHDRTLFRKRMREWLDANPRPRLL